MATWYELIRYATRNTEDDVDKLDMTLTDEELYREFDDSYGGSEGEPFTAWSDDWVYFPVVYDGAEWVGRVPRNPCAIATEHQGGE